MDAIGEGEANDLRVRLGAIERRVAEAESRTSVHEEKCAGRYKLILVLSAVNIAINAPTALPHFLSLLGLMK